MTDSADQSPEENTWAEGVQMIRDAVVFYREQGHHPDAEMDWLAHYDAAVRGPSPPLDACETCAGTMIVRVCSGNHGGCRPQCEEPCPDCIDEQMSHDGLHPECLPVGGQEQARAARQRLASEQTAYAREAIDAGTTLVQAVHTRALDAAVDAFETAVRGAADEGARAEIQRLGALVIDRGQKEARWHADAVIQRVNREAAEQALREIAWKADYMHSTNLTAEGAIRDIKRLADEAIARAALSPAISESSSMSTTAGEVSETARDENKDGSALSEEEKGENA